jgi:hypothetical protein
MADQFSNIEVNESGDGCYRHVDDWVQLRFGDGYKVSVTVNETDFVRYTVIPRKPSLSGVDGEPITSSVYNRFRVKAWNSEGELVLDEVYKTGDVLTDDHDPDLEYMMLSCAVEYDHDTQALTEEIDIEHPLHLHTMNVTYGPKARNQRDVWKVSPVKKGEQAIGTDPLFEFGTGRHSIFDDHPNAPPGAADRVSKDLQLKSAANAVLVSVSSKLL